MTPEQGTNNIVMQEIMELITHHGLDSMREVMTVILDEAMKAERMAFLNAKPYERSEERRGYANGFKPKTITTRVGAMTVEIPQVRGLSFYPRCLEKGCRSERALKLALATAYIQGVSTRKIAQITEELCGVEISSTQVSRIASVLDEELEKFRNRSLGAYPYLILDARYEKVRQDHQVRDVAVLIAIGVNTEGKREVLGVSGKLSEAEVHWREFLQHLVQRGLHGVTLITSDDHSGLGAARKSIFPAVPWQRCQFHFAQNAQHYAPKKSMKDDIAQAVRDIFSCLTLEDAQEKVKGTAERYRLTAPEFASWLEANIHQCFTVYALPREHRIKLRTSNSLENLNRQVKRRTRVACIFPHIDSCLRLVTAVLLEIHEDWIIEQNLYLNMKLAK